MNIHTGKKNSSLLIVSTLGDLSLPLFGMSKAKFETLSQALGDSALFIHNGALVNASLGASALRTVNVGGTAELLKLAVNRKVLLVNN